MKTTRGEPRTFFLAALRAETDECVIWPFKLQNGYGRMWDNSRRRSLPVPFLMCEHAHGPCPAGMQAMHGPCHNRACINPRHLRWGTAKENAADRRRDGTHLCGERVHGSKLTAAAVVSVRERWAAGERDTAQFAREFGVDRSLIRLIVKRKVWTHV